MGRDRNRTPMQWSDAPNGGFCPQGTEPWLPVNPDFAAGVNVSAQDNAPDSLLNFYRKLLKLRKQHPALQTGDFQEIETDNENILIFRRWNEQEELVMLFNLSDAPREAILPYPDRLAIFSNVPVENNKIEKTPLAAYQGIIYIIG